MSVACLSMSYLLYSLENIGDDTHICIIIKVYPGRKKHKKSYRTKPIDVKLTLVGSPFPATP